MPIASDFTVSVTGDIRHSSGTSHYTVLELHRFLQALADDAVASGDDLVDITSSTPSERSTDNIITLTNGYNIDDTAAEYFYAGSIKQGSGGTEVIYSGLMVLGAVNNTDTQIQIVQDNALYDATPFWGTQASGGYNGNATAGILMRILVKSRTAGADIDGKRVRVQARHWGDTYDFFNVTLGEGESVAALGTTPDAQNTTLIATVQGWTGGDIPTNTPGYQTINLNNGNGAQPYYSKWTYNSNALGLRAIWEWIKELTSQASPAADLYGLSGDLFLGITHEVSTGGTHSGTFVQSEEISWGTGATAGTGQLLATDDTSNPTKIWMQLTSGVIPTGAMTISGASASTTCSSVTAKTVPKIFLGSYTGTLIGAFGIGVDADDLTASDTIQDLLGVTQTPPNNVVFTVSGLVSGHDYVLVGPKDTGNAFKFDQLSLKTALTGAGVTSIVCTTTIPADTPAAGTLRIELDSGIYRLINYTSWASDTFTIESSDFTDPNDASSSNNIMITYIDRICDDTSEAFTTIYSAPRDLFVRVRDGGASPIKTFESPAQLGSAGGSSVASRIVDV